MKAIIIEKFGGPEVLTIKEIPKPEPEKGKVVIKVKAFGINHAETYMRKGEWAESMPVSGIECVGIVDSCPGGEFKVGEPVAAFMGGLGRTVNGSYAEYTRASVSNVLPLGEQASKLTWAQLAAIPESYATAWACLNWNLELKAGQKLLVRGGTSALGLAAINLAVQAGAHVTATTRSADRTELLKSHGVENVVIEDLKLSQKIIKSVDDKFDAVLELIGNSTIVNSIRLVHRGGRLCLAGFLGGLAPVQDFNPLAEMASGVHFSFFGSFVFGEPEFPVSEVKLKDVVRMISEKKFNADPSRVFKFDEIQEAHRVMEASQAKGKLVVVVDDSQ
ncbi:hypothetical protein TRVA0_044S00518 [Trichomonascus vanleenenianus]|uniref:uncharacterized protein n=1 Tax=Trichomonascus vanleenenianus TaxID=2268995 RepID=UPI003ECB81D1